MTTMYVPLSINFGENGSNKIISSVCPSTVTKIVAKHHSQNIEVFILFSKGCSPIELGEQVSVDGEILSQRLD